MPRKKGSKKSSKKAPANDKGVIYSKNRRGSGKRKTYSQAEKDKAAKLFKEGRTHGEIAKILGCHQLTVYGWLRKKREEGKAPTPRKKRVPAKAGAVKGGGHKKRFSILDANGETIRRWKFRKLNELGSFDAKNYYIKTYNLPKDGSLTWDQAEAKGLLRFAACKVSKSGSNTTFANYFRLNTAFAACQAHSNGKKIPVEASPARAASSSSNASNAPRNSEDMETYEAEALMIFIYAEEAFGKLISKAADARDYAKINFLSGCAQKLQEIKGDL